MTQRTPVQGAAGHDGAAPQMVIDEHGREVGVLLGHAEYIALLAHLAAHAGGADERDVDPAPPAYWRRALATWIPGAVAAGSDPEAGSR